MATIRRSRRRVVRRRRAPRRSGRPTRRTTSVRKAKRTQPCVCPGALTPGDRFVLAQLDPFETKCLGAKVPDSNTVPSVSNTTTENFNLGMLDGSKMKCWAFLPGYVSSIAQASEAAAGWVWPAAFGGASSWVAKDAYAADAEADRTIAHAIRLTSGVAPTSASGFVHIAVAVEAYNGITTWPYPTSPAGLSGYSFYKRVTLSSLTQSPLTIINKYTDDTAFRYKGADALMYGNAGQNEFHIPFSYGALLVAVEGGSAGQVSPLSAEMILHTEYIPKNSAGNSGTAAAPYNPEIMRAASTISAASDFAHTEDQQDTFVAQGLSAVNEGLSAARDTAMSQYIAPALRQGAYNMAGSAFMYAFGRYGNRGIGGVNNNPNRLGIE